MHLPSFLRRALLRALQRRCSNVRQPDFIVGGKEDPYLRRWYVIPRNRWCNVYFHHFLRSDDDRALHDHPWTSVSLILKGGYFEHVPEDDGLGCPELADVERHWRPEGYVGWRRGEGLHRVELMVDRHWMQDEEGIRQPDRLVTRPAWTLFITGPKYREWGFACPKGWKHWMDFCDPNDKGRAGPGCD